MGAAASAEPLRVGGSGWAIPVALIGLALLVTPFLARGPTLEDRRLECALVTEVAVSLGVQRIAGSLGDGAGDPRPPAAIDCRSDFIQAGMTVVESSDALPARFIFARPRFADRDSVSLNMGRVCGPACGSGERLTVVRRDGRWIVVASEPTWIA
ncbi:MAG: hypothetical protein ABW360_13910 [Phenylobacterium sp.]